MKILVCFKIVRELDTVLSADWEKAQDGDFDIGYTKKIINCFDESALETALCISSETGIEAYALTIGEGDIERYLKNLYAVGYSSVTRIECHKDLDFMPRTKAKIIADFASEFGRFDAIFMGHQAGAGDHAVIPFLTAEHLGMPCINMVTDVEFKDNIWRAECEWGGGKRRINISEPAVYAFSNARHTYLRVPTLREKMAVKDKKINVIKKDKVQECKENELLRLWREKNNRAGEIIKGKSTQDKVKILMEAYVSRIKDK